MYTKKNRKRRNKKTKGGEAFAIPIAAGTFFLGLIGTLAYVHLPNANKL